MGTRTRTGDRTEDPAGSRVARWRAGWRVSLRMARRDVRRHRGRSLLVVVMVGLPVLLLTTATTLYFTDDLDAPERLPFQLAQSQGYVVAPQPTQLQQLLDPFEQLSREGEPPPARPVPGLRPGREGVALAALLRARLVEVSTVPATIRTGEHYVSGAVLGAEFTDPAMLAPRVTLESGRWPTGPGEALVTAQGLERGLPRSGTLGVRVIGSGGEAPERSVTIVGVGRGLDAQGSRYLQQTELVSTPVTSDYAIRQWLVERSAPITWGEVERLNTYGVGVFSRYVAEHPDTVTRPVNDTGSDDLLLVTSMAALGLVLLTTLLAGPAFAVSAARARRTLALAASNGATTAQLRRTVLAQALVLGALSALVGAALGVAGGIGAVEVTRAVRPDLFFGPLQVPWPAVAAVSGAAVVSSVVAALVPSRGLGRLDIVSVLRGQSVSPRLRRRVPAAGAVLVLAGAATVTATSVYRPDLEFLYFAGGSVALVVGALLVVPLVLALAARVAHRLPLPLRMAAREAGRQRGRATPTVAAIMGSAAVLSVVCIGLQADTVRAARDHVAVVREGQGVVMQGAAPPTRLLELAPIVEREAPEADALVLDQLVDYSQPGGAGMLAAERPGCALSDILPQAIGGDAPSAPSMRCATASSFGRDVNGTSLLAADPDQLAAFLGLTDAQRDAIKAGAVAVVDPADVAGLALPTPESSMVEDLETLRPVPLEEKHGSATFLAWKQAPGETDTATPPDASAVRRVTLRVVHVPRDRWNRAVQLYTGSPAGIVSTATATGLGLPVAPTSLLVRADGGLSREVEARITDALRARQGDAELTVERGFQRDDTLTLIVVLGVIGLVILVATLIATALSQTENAPLLGTLAAVGATRRTRRSLAGAQALFLGLLGAALGVLVGLAPGIGLARVVLTTIDDAGVTLPDSIPVPWLQILAPVLLVPLVAGALAWVSIRRAPVVVRRAT